ncbi:MAG: condensation domain-containing protein [Silanimonas sp.]
MVQGRFPLSAAERPSLARLFVRRCEASGPEPLYRFLGDDVEVREQLDGTTLLAESAALAAQLVQSTAPGARIILLFPPGLDVVRAFWACVLAGRLAVPVPSLDAARLKNAAPRLKAIVDDAGASLMLTTPAMAATWPTITALPEIPILALGVDRLEALPCPFDDVPDDPDAPVYLQYTSGSTGTPRGVVIDSTNVLAQCDALARCHGIADDTRILSWLPHHHDFGLVMGVLTPVCTSARAWLMSPMSFLRRPLRWLDAIGRHGITHTGAPNFAYAACTAALRATPGWQADLRGLRSLSCGAEPIHSATLAAFAEAFAPHGLDAGALSPAYGMAESVLAISQASPGAGMGLRALPAMGGRPVVSCGRAVPGTTLRIVDAVTRTACAEGVEGEIWVTGDSVARGYWGDAARSVATFDAFDALGSGPYLRTGDLGVLLDGELYVTGRLKDLIIVRGRNVHPQDVEWCAQSVDASLRRGYGAAFAVDADSGDAVVLVQELERGVADPQRLAAAVRRAVADAEDLPLSAVVFVKSGSLPRTSSGKIPRRACRDDYLSGRLSVLHVDAGGEPRTTAGGAPLPRAGREAELAALWSDVLGVAAIARDDGFIALGGDSLRATQLASRLGERLGLDVGVDWVLAQADLAGMAASLEALITKTDAPAAPAAGREVRRIPRVVDRRDAPTSFSQRRMWLVQQLAPETTAYNMAFAFRLRGALDPARLAAAVDAVARRHEVFRTHLALVGDDVRQCLGEPMPTPMSVEDFRGVVAPQREAAARRWMEALIRRPFDLSTPPLHHAHLGRLDDDDHVFLWTIHHAIGDLWSFGVLLHELSQAYLDPAGFGALPPPSLDYVDYAHWQRSPAREFAVAAQVERWCERLRGVEPLALPADRRRTGPPDGRGGRVGAPLPEATRDAVKRLAAQLGATPFMVLLAVFHLLLRQATGQHDIAVATPIANRHRLDLEPLVGTFVNTVVLRVDLAGNPGFDALVQRVRGVALEAYADQDAPFETLVSLLAPGRPATTPPLANVMFNLVSVPFEARSLGGHRIEAFDVDHGGAQFDLSLSVDLDVFGLVHFEYAEDRFERRRAAALLEAYLNLLTQALTAPTLPIDDFDPGVDRDGAVNDGPAEAAIDALAHAATAHGGASGDAVNSVERRMLDLARDLVDDAELDHSFFDAGGHSLLALRFARHVEDEFGVRLSLVAMARSSLRGLAAEVRAAHADRDAAG